MAQSQAVQERLERALDISVPEPQEVEDYLRYEIASSTPGKSYDVDVRPGTLRARCSCPDFQHNKVLWERDGKKYRVCKHVLAVLRERGEISESPQCFIEHLRAQTQQVLEERAASTEDSGETLRDGPYWLERFTDELVELAVVMVDTRYGGMTDVEDRRADAIIDLVQASNKFNPEFGGRVNDSIGNFLYFLACQLAGRIRKQAVLSRDLAQQELSEQVVAVPPAVRNALVSSLEYLADSQIVEDERTFRRLEDQVLLTTPEVVDGLLEDEKVREAVTEYFQLKDPSLLVLHQSLRFLLQEAVPGDWEAETFVEQLERPPFVRAEDVHDITVTTTTADGDVAEEHLSAEVFAKQIIRASGGDRFTDDPQVQIQRVQDDVDDYIAELNMAEIPDLPEEYVKLITQFTYVNARECRRSEARYGLPRLEHPITGNFYLYNLHGEELPEDVEVIYIGRGGNGQDHFGNTPVNEKGWLGNPYPVNATRSREESIEAFRQDFETRLHNDEEFVSALAEVREKVYSGEAVLACYCAPLPCHGDVILEALLEDEYKSFLEHRANAPDEMPLDLGVLVGAISKGPKGPYGQLAEGLWLLLEMIPEQYHEAALHEIVGQLDQVGAGATVSWDPDDKDIELIRLVRGPLAKALLVELDHHEEDPSATELRQKVEAWVDNFVSDRNYRCYPSQASAIKAGLRGANVHEIKAVQNAAFGGGKPQAKKHYEDGDLEAALYGLIDTDDDIDPELYI